MIHQPSGTMNVIRCLVVMAAGAAAGMAQTNLEYVAPIPPSADTNAPTNPTNAPAPNSRRLSLQECIQLALERNLPLQIARYNPQLALFAYNGALGGYDPTFSFSGEHDYAQSGSRLLGGSFVLPNSTTYDDKFNTSLGGLLPWGMTYSLQGNTDDAATHQFGTNGLESTTAFASVNLTQPLLRNFWIDATRLTIRINKNKLKQSELALKWQIIQTITALEQAYYDLIYNRENVVVQQKAVELAERTVFENRTKLQYGAMAPLDLDQAEAQAASSRAALLAARSQLGTQERVLKSLITDDFPQWADLVLVPTENLTVVHQVFDRKDSWSKALTQRPDLLQAKLDVENQGIQLKYNRNQLFPQLDAFGSYGYNGAGKEFSDAFYTVQQRDFPAYTVGGQFSIPLANAVARNNFKAAKATLQQIMLLLKQDEQAIMLGIDNDIGTAQADYEQVLATRVARQYAESALKAEETKLQNGKSTVYTVLQNQRDVTTARGQEIQALDNYLKSLSTLSQDEGSTLDRLGIDWQAK